MTSRLEVLGATVRFADADVEALAGVDLHVDAGETVVVFGPSGSGKSTLLRAVAGLQALSAGRVVLDGEDMGPVPPHRRGVGLMFQDHALFPHLDVGDNVAFGLRMQGRPRSVVRARVAELLELVGLAQSAGRPIQTLSGGEQQRVALARSLAPEPSVLLLDEPLGALDRPLRQRLVGELRDLFDRLGLAVLAVTHDREEAFALADRLVVVDAGRVLQAGAPPAVWAAPTSARVARLLGLSNVAPASIEEGRLVGPWGDLGPSVASEVVAVAIRPEGVILDPSGPIAGTVMASTFGGARARLEVAVAGGPPLEAEVPGVEAPTVGTEVRLRLDRSAITALPG